MNATITSRERVEKWQDRLLDLTLRNPLLNQYGKSYLPIVCPDPHLLEDRLAKGNKIAIVRFPRKESELSGEDLNPEEKLDIEFDSSIEDETAASSTAALNEFALKQITKQSSSAVVVDMSEAELRKRETNIYRKARNSLLEGGAGTLYLAFGFLEWKRENDDKIRRAPLVLVPVYLERKSVKDGIKILASDDETRVNKTLLEMLRKDFGIIISDFDGDLPEDEYGVDVKKIWDIFRRAVAKQDGFKICEDIILGNFSFVKYLMWADLVSRADTLAGSNGVVKHLMHTPNQIYDGGESIEPRTLDDKFATKDLLLPLEADSSQIACVAAADQGNDFITIGPPGTGKSQTICNIIAHMIGKGKSVLFVSEKKAALDVVYRRLSEINLEKFCLELHSNKANKKNVLGQLKQAADFADLRDPSEWEKCGQELQEIRTSLNMFVESLHKKRSNGYSAFEGIGLKVKHANSSWHVPLNWSTSDEHSEEELDHLEKTVRTLSSDSASVDFSCDFIYILSETSWGPAWEKNILEVSSKLSSDARRCEDDAKVLLNNLDLRGHWNESLKELEGLSDLSSVLLLDGMHEAGKCLADNISVDDLLSAAEQLENYRASEAQLQAEYPDFGWRQLDIESLHHQLSEASQEWWLPRKNKTRKLSKTLSPFCEGKPDAARDLPVLLEMSQFDKQIQEFDQKLSGQEFWQGHSSDTDALLKLANMTKKLLETMQASAKPAQLRDLREAIASASAAEERPFGYESPIGAACAKFVEAFDTLKATDEEFSKIALESPLKVFAEAPDMLRKIATAGDSIKENKHSLHDWCRWIKTKETAEKLGLDSLVEAAENETIPSDALPEAFKASYWEWWTAAVIEEDSTLRNFSSQMQETIIQDFCALDTKYQKVTSKYIASQIAQNISQQRLLENSSDWGELRRYMNQKRPRITVRELHEKFSNILTTLTPCWMMSPLSVSQYLPAGKGHFDVVIFDEASQITTWDAIGTLARAKQVIVAGDPKQMPPSNFFQRQDEDEEDELNSGEIPDLESILDEMESASIPKQHLNLHYRSKKEDLIAFSNNRYYENRLITFPPPFDKKGVSLVKSNGIYTPGSKARTNLIEARLVVDEILKRLRHKDKAIRDASMGVVTFNQTQQQLIEDLLDIERKNDPSIEVAFSEDIVEPIFVKNLETVQGDERDVILFSVGYGPDSAGNPPAMRFGPVNQDGGERRLNVAFTRAKQEMKIFTSLLPEHMRVTPSTPQGVKDLKDFLLFAERGVLSADIAGSIGSSESVFEEEVILELRKRSWDVEPQIGVSKFRIDIGVIHPERPGEYLAGIECDGATYHSSYTARERDKLRQQVLENLGWKLYRIWSTDWWHDRDKAADAIHKQLLDCLEKNKAHS